MDLEIKSWLYDILNAIEEINSFFNGPKEFVKYQNDIRTKEQSKEILKSLVKQ